MISEAPGADKPSSAPTRSAICYHTPGSAERTENLARISYEEAYPGISFWPRSRNWWARLKGMPAECVHRPAKTGWMATLLPDIIFFVGQSEARHEPLRPEILLCRECLMEVATSDLAAFRGRIVAFEPEPSVTQYFFVGAADFAPAGMTAEVEEALAERLAQDAGSCAVCERAATWLWFPRAQVASLDDFQRIRDSAGERLCAAHGAQKLRKAFEKIEKAHLNFMNLPYGEAGAYVWI
jgi:hypothetical protein